MEKTNISENQNQYKTPLEKGLQISSILFCIYNLFKLSFQEINTSNLIENVVLTVSSVFFLYGTSKKDIKTIGQYCMIMFSDVFYNLVNFMTNAIGYLMMTEKFNKYNEENGQNLKKRQVSYENEQSNGHVDHAALAEAMGAPKEIVEKIKETQERIEGEEGRTLTFGLGADLAEAGGAPEFIVERLRALESVDLKKENNDQNFGEPNEEFDIGKVAEGFGAPPEAVEKAREAQERAEAEGRDYDLLTAADLAEAAGAPAFVVNNLRNKGLQELEEKKSQEAYPVENYAEGQSLSKRQNEDAKPGRVDFAAFAEAMGAPPEAVEKARADQRKVEEQGGTLTFGYAAELAEAGGAPDFVVDRLKAISDADIKNEINNENKEEPAEGDFDIGNVAAAFGAPPEAIEKAREAQDRIEAEGGEFSLLTAANLAEAAGAPEFVVNNLRNKGLQEAEEKKSQEAYPVENYGEGQGLSKRQNEDAKPGRVDFAAFAEAMGAPPEAVEKARAGQKMVEEQGETLTFGYAAELAEAGGAPDFVVDRLKAISDADMKNEINNENKEEPAEGDFDIGNVATAFGAPPEAIEKAREAQDRIEAEGGEFSLLTAANLAEAAGAPEFVVNNLRNKGLQEAEEKKSQEAYPVENYAEGQSLSKRQNEDAKPGRVDFAAFAEAMGAPPEAVEKAREGQEKFENQENTSLSFSVAADLAEAGGAPDFVVDRLRAVGKVENENNNNNKNNEEKPAEGDFDIGKVAAAFGAPPEAVEKAREAQERAKEEGRVFDLNYAADLAEAAGAPEFVVNNLRSKESKEVEKEFGQTLVKRELSDGLLNDASFTNAIPNAETIGELNVMKNNMYAFGKSGLLALILGCFAYKYYRQIKRQIKNKTNVDVKYQQV
ncbi:hypothetical protein PIROE2DRAFT_8090 [Piromyces sp. E2]|nr:hypothetical protein PIROE2DRAFT_8090 [Piromyces sp. E2]|eukprot:OUM65027.1 hypothetical protein PIROE2DRAFT_8090 [Piromyces sp. E2]